MNYPTLIESLIKLDANRYAALRVAASLNLKDWCLSAGFVRNLVWDYMHEKQKPTPLNDIDFVYFDATKPSIEVDKQYESLLHRELPLPWSVKNQARMHGRNQDLPYTCVSDAMSYWPEIETAVGVTLDTKGTMQFIAPFGLEALFTNTITINPKRRKPDVFAKRLKDKKWQTLWPKLTVNA